MRAALDLRSIAAGVLALGLSSCCLNVDDQTSREYYYDPISGEALDTLRASDEDDEARCEAACMELALELDGLELDTVERCIAEGDVQIDAPWSEENTEVLIDCDGTITRPGVCMGRRPQGHRESMQPVDSLGAWFAASAHLEAASVTAFAELADWLERRAAPGSLVSRCRDAADDEVMHAGMMARLAKLYGGSLEPVESDPPDDALRSVALHNAVEGCVHEAFAAITAAAQAQNAASPRLRDTFARIADDELRHGQLAWDLHAWFLDQLDEDGRAVVVHAQRRAFSELAHSARSNAAATPKALGWPTPDAAEAMARAFAEQAMH